ncbi:hypothetical protein MTO96_011826 [Rhipicephalus appendiculatus]
MRENRRCGAPETPVCVGGGALCDVQAATAAFGGRWDGGYRVARGDAGRACRSGQPPPRSLSAISSGGYHRKRCGADDECARLRDGNTCGGNGVALSIAARDAAAVALFRASCAPPPSRQHGQPLWEGPVVPSTFLLYLTFFFFSSYNS